MMLIRRYSYLTLKFSSPVISESGRWESSWNGGRGTIADTEGGLLARVLEELQDCGAEGHWWETTGERRDPVNGEYVILTQRLACAYCDEKEQVITLYHPGPTAAESAGETHLQARELRRYPDDTSAHRQPLSG